NAVKAKAETAKKDFLVMLLLLIFSFIFFFNISLSSLFLSTGKAGA
ncbi:MAG: hypothetical protein ACI9E1_002448, partial [Cryomorphaceae bacterium]